MRLAPLLLALSLASPGCTLCWPRGGAVQQCPTDDDDADDDDADDDDADDDDAVEDPCAGAPTSYDVGAASFEVVCVPPGDFIMGSGPGESGRSQDEVQHRVDITRPLLAAVHETTQLLYLEGSGGLAPSDCNYGCGDTHPVQRVTWLAAVDFAGRLSDAHGLTRAHGGTEEAPTLDLDADGWRLPTEAEWERLARGGVLAQPYSGGTVL